MSRGNGSKGQRWYDWAWVTLHDDSPGIHTLLIRRNRAGELAFYKCWTPQPVSLSTLVTTAGLRWTVEENFQIAKGQVGLDHYPCRGWTPWHRFAVLAMLALAILTIVNAAERSRVRISYLPAGLIELTVPETRRLINMALAKPVNIALAIALSHWRRRHQAQAKASHYEQRASIESEQLAG